MDAWLIRNTKNQLTGPFPRDIIVSMIDSGRLRAEDEICSGQGYWIYLRETDEVKKYLNLGTLPYESDPEGATDSIAVDRTALMAKPAEPSNFSDDESLAVDDLRGKIEKEMSTQVIKIGDLKGAFEYESAQAKGKVETQAQPSVSPLHEVPKAPSAEPAPDEIRLVGALNDPAVLKIDKSESNSAHLPFSRTTALDTQEFSIKRVLTLVLLLFFVVGSGFAVLHSFFPETTVEMIPVAEPEIPDEGVPTNQVSIEEEVPAQGGASSSASSALKWAPKSLPAAKVAAPTLELEGPVVTLAPAPEQDPALSPATESAPSPIDE